MKRRWIKWVLITAFATALCVGGITLVSYLIDGAQSGQLYVDTADTYYDVLGEPAQPDSVPVPQEDDSAYMDAYKALADINADAVGWVSIEGTDIDYPVVQADDNDYYHRRDINKKRSARGTIYMDWRCTAVGGSHLVLYGHNMKDGSMFGTLKAYQDAAYYALHPYITYNMMGYKTRWRIFSVRMTDDTLLPVSFSGDDLAVYAQQIKEQSQYDTDVDVSQPETILTLSTCTGGNGRLLVSAVRADPTGLDGP